MAHYSVLQSDKEDTLTDFMHICTFEDVVNSIFLLAFALLIHLDAILCFAFPLYSTIFYSDLSIYDLSTQEKRASIEACEIIFDGINFLSNGVQTVRL